jgi:hypothetical protein
VVGPLEAGPAGDLAATERYRVAGRRSGAGGLEPPAKSFGACSVRAAAAATATVPAASAEPVPAGGPDDRSDDHHPERSAEPLTRIRRLHGSTRRRRELISELRTHAAELVWHAGADHD